MFARFFQILAVSAAFSTALIGYASAADKRRVCSGEWTDMRRIGLSIGDCDLLAPAEKVRGALTPQFPHGRC